MKQISGEEFKELLYSNTTETVENLIVELQGKLEIDLQNIKLNYNFKRITFLNSELCFIDKIKDIKKEKNPKLEFYNCVFNSKLIFSQCSLYCLSVLSSVFNSSLFELSNCYLRLSVQIDRCVFSNSSVKMFNSNMSHLSIIGSNIEDIINILECKISQRILISDLNVKNIYFTSCFLMETIISRVKSEIIHFNICQLDDLCIDIGNKNLKNNFKFNNCQFEKTKFFNINSNKIDFYFKDCEFKTILQFDGLIFGKFSLDNVVFNKSVSFQETVLDSISINKTVFEKGAYFDEIKINEVLSKNYLKDKTKILGWKRTLRSIKQELQKSENRIDFNRFKFYELAAHYEELDWKWKSGFIDKSILFSTKISTDFGNSWRKALRFTIIGGFVFYLIFYSIENHSCTFDLSNLKNWSNLFSGFFRFLLVTDFNNPLETGRTYLTNPISWFVFILGKIFIAFGIYEMIQSFRKFKA